MTEQTFAPRPANAVDLRSDTVTLPTEAMYERMRGAPIGDDALDGDPTVRELEAYVAAQLGKQAGLFVPSCTMANLLAVLAQTQRNEQVILESTAHMYTSERGAATFTGVFYHCVPGADGAMDLNRLEEALLTEGMRLKTSLVAMETTHNNAGGTVLPLDHMRSVYGMANSRGISVHLDGRACTTPPWRWASRRWTSRSTPTLCRCACPGPERAGRRGAGRAAPATRQGPHAAPHAGRRAAPGRHHGRGLEAVRPTPRRAAERGLNRLHPRLSATVPQTNIVQVETADSGMGNAQWVQALAAEGVLTRPWGVTRLRCVTHRHIGAADIDRAVQTFGRVLQAS